MATKDVGGMVGIFTKMLGLFHVWVHLGKGQIPSPKP